ILCVEVLTVTFSLWWIYFDDVAHSPLKPLPIAPYVWIYSHLPLVASLSLLGSGIVLSLKHTAVEPLPAAHRWLLCGGLSATFLSIAAIDWVSERRQAELSDSARVRGRIVSGIATCVLAPVGMSMQPWAFVGLLASICILQLVIDMNVVPTASDMPIQRAPSARPSSPKAPERASRKKTKDRQRRDVSEAVRRGAPSEIRSDLYFFLMEGSWTRLLGTMVTGYLLINVVFGALYVLDSDSIVNAHPGSFLDAFFFSVQTMSTLGYGVLSPASTYSNLLVTIEAGTGLLLTALATGLMFAKVSRPRKAVLFSDVLTMTRYHGKKALMLRAGNARGNMLLEATARLSVLMEDDSPEGHQIRRLYDLKLIRDSTPVFALSWLMIHIIDEQSPLHGIESKDMEEKALLFIGILTGFDSTYAQTTHAQRIWYPEDIRFNSRFVDVVADLPDGRILIDYERFHDTHIDEPFTIEQNEFTPAEPKKS
ncbi:MAG: low temperature requirement protein A, partial [Myxococcota bacterium]